MVYKRKEITPEQQLVKSERLKEIQQKKEAKERKKGEALLEQVKKEMFNDMLTYMKKMRKK
jgi:hypothetical protein